MARPLIEIDWSQVDKMCEIHCTGEEQASILGVDYDTLNSACKREKGQNFSDYLTPILALSLRSYRNGKFRG